MENNYYSVMTVAMPSLVSDSWNVQQALHFLYLLSLFFLWLGALFFFLGHPYA